MDESIMTSQVQSILYNLMFKLLEKMPQETGQAAAADTPTTSGTGSSASSGQSSAGASFATLIQQASDRYGVNPSLVNAVIRAESNFDASAVSGAGALGLMQLMPGTAQGLGVSDPMDPAQNIEGGVKFLSQLLKKYDGNVQMTLAAYNAGPGAVAKYNGVPPYSETQTYVKRVLSYMQSGGNGWEA